MSKSYKIGTGKLNGQNILVGAIRTFAFCAAKLTFEKFEGAWPGSAETKPDYQVSLQFPDGGMGDVGLAWDKAKGDRKYISASIGGLGIPEELESFAVFSNHDGDYDFVWSPPLKAEPEKAAA